MQRAIRTALGSFFFKRGPLGRGLPPSLPAIAFSCLLSRCPLSLSLACAPSGRHGASTSHAGPFDVDSGIGAVCGLAAKSSRTAPTPCTRLQSVVPQSAVMGPPPGPSRGPGCRGCAPAAACLPDPSCPLSSSPSPALRAPVAPRPAVAPLAQPPARSARSRRATSPSQGHAPTAKAPAALFSDAQTAAAATAQIPTELVATPRQLRERARHKSQCYSKWTRPKSSLMTFGAPVWGPVNAYLSRVHRWITLARFHAIWAWDLSNVWRPLSSPSASSSLT